MASLFDRIARLVSEECGVAQDRLTPETTLFGDLHIDGADGSDLLERFAREFGVDMSGCDISLYFGPEGISIEALFDWVVYVFKKGRPEEKAGLLPIRISDLVRSADRRRWHVARWLCPTCSYDLTGNTSGTCPECGTAIPKTPEPKSHRPA